VRLRPAAPEDLEAVAAVVHAGNLTFRDWAPPGWQPPALALIRSSWAGRLADGPARGTLVACDQDGAVTGVTSWRPSGTPGVAHLSALYVHPAHWRTGVGGALLDAATAAMAATGAGRARLVTPAESPARAFYAARGWRDAGPARPGAGLEHVTLVRELP
jgi:GNAT superfamily N-acetyltransferase